MINIAIMGHGFIGSGVVEVLTKNHDHNAKKAKEEINIKHILELRDFSDLDYSDKFTKDFSVIENDDSVKIVVETMGGTNPAYQFVKACLLKGKSVVTSNKELVAEKGAELLKIAEEKNVNFLFEGSVGGGIPILRPIAQCLAANDILEIVGILNGTTNFILTKMVEEGMNFDDAVSLAQHLGYAERDPSADVDGHDACRKICILASLAFGKHVYPSQVKTEGIRKISLEDFEYAKNGGYTIKLLGRTKLLDSGKVIATVGPSFVDHASPLYNVSDVFNSVLVRGDAIGDVSFYGRGAGKLPTASAVVADVIDCVKHLAARKYLSWAEGSEDYVQNPETESKKLYVRILSGNKHIKNIITEKFNGAVFLSRENQPENEFAFITPSLSTEKIMYELSTVEDCTIIGTMHILE